MNSKSLDADSTSPPPPSSSATWKERIFFPTLLAGFAGGGVGLLSKHRMVHGLPYISATYATNSAIVTACYCGAREFVRVNRRSDPDDLMNSAVAGFGTGALLGRLQGGQFGAFRYSIIFAVVGTTVDFAIIRLRAKLMRIKEDILGYREKEGGWFKLPEWSPIQVLDEEALAAKEAHEKQLYAQRAVCELSKEES